MSKRRAGVELTHENWDVEVEEEEAGTFAVADKDTLSKRPIIRAKRRVAQQEGSQAQTPFAAFKGFTGFGGTPASTAPSGSFGSFKAASTGADSAKSSAQNTFKFGSTAASQSVKPNTDTKPAADAKPTFSFKPSSELPQSTSMFSNKSETDSKASSNGGASLAKSGENGASNLEAYASELRALNRSVSAWIQKHVETNPVCDLTPIFDDYKKHFEEIERKQEARKRDQGSEVKAKPQLATVSPLTAGQDKSSSSSASSFGGFKFGSSSAGSASTGETEAKESSAPTKTGFGFGSGSSENKGFSFGSGSSENKGFSFGSSGASSSLSSSSSTAKPAGSFSFAGLSAKPTTSGEAKQTDAQEEPSDEPPKVEVKVIEEKDSLFSTRCKVFYKTGKEFKERGVGMLHLKNTGGSGQILVRADTSLGNVILNIGVSASMVKHFTKQGKNNNNIMLLSPLNPPADKKCPKCNKNYLNPQESTACEEGCTADPTPLLIRVKTEADVDKIIGEIKKIFED